jgi:hypothetical protein
MAKYILGMARKRATSTDPVERECIKKAMNSLYGKMLQDPSKQRNLVPYTSTRAFVRACARPNCVSFEVKQYDQPGVGFFGLVETSKKGGSLLNTPRAAGFVILDNSKLWMLRYHYLWFKEKFGNLPSYCSQTPIRWLTRSTVSVSQMRCWRLFVSTLI